MCGYQCDKAVTKNDTIILKTNYTYNARLMNNFAQLQR